MLHKKNLQMVRGAILSGKYLVKWGRAGACVRDGVDIREKRISH